MADEPTTTSGSRWEPDAENLQKPADETPADGPPPATAQAWPGVPPEESKDDPVAQERRARLRTRAVLAGAATALALGGGLTGFVIGHSTAGDDSTGFPPAGFSGQRPGGDQLGEGRQGPPSFHDGDRDGGDGGDGFGPSQGGTDGDTSGS
jgi:hypothetical protein